MSLSVGDGVVWQVIFISRLVFKGYLIKSHAALCTSLLCLKTGGDNKKTREDKIQYLVRNFCTELLYEIAVQNWNKVYFCLLCFIFVFLFLLPYLRQHALVFKSGRLLCCQKFNNVIYSELPFLFLPLEKNCCLS